MPGAAGPPFRNRRARRVSLRARLMFLAAAAAALRRPRRDRARQRGEMLGELGGFAGLMLVGLAPQRGAARRGGLRRPRRRPAAGDPAQALRRGADRRQHRRRGPARPRPEPRSAALAFGVVAGGAQLLAFGLDPMRKKGLEGVDDFVHRAGRPRHRPGRGAGAPDRRRREADRRPAARGPGRAALRPGARGLPRRRAGPARSRTGRGPSSASICSACATRRRSSPTSGAAAATRWRARPTRICSAIWRRASPPSAPTCSRTTAAISTSRSRCCASGCNRTG